MKLIPAYGRDYKSKKAIAADLAMDKDFIISDYFNRYDGKPINLSQLMEEGYKQVTVRYQQLQKVAVIKLPEVK